MRDKRTLSHAPLGGLDALGLRIHYTEQREREGEGAWRLETVAEKKEAKEGTDCRRAHCMRGRERGREREDSFFFRLMK